MPHSPSHFSPLDEEELVAYLDGELDDAACERVEQRLASDAAYRGELQRLQRAWDYLDRLPETEVDESFTRSTIEMVSLAASQELTQLQQTVPARRRAWVGLTAAMLLVALLTGFALTAVIWPDPNQQLLRELPLIENFEQYQALDDFAALKAVAGAGIFSADAADATLDEALPTREDDSLWGRRTWVKALAPAEQAAVRNSQQRFLALEPAEQDRLRTLHAQIAAAPQRAELEQTLAAYHAWLAELSPGQRSDLAALDGEKRVQAIARLHREQQAKRSRTLSPADMELLFAWLGETAQAHRERILRGMPEPFRKHLAKQSPEQQQAALIWMAYRKSRFTPQAPLAALDPGEVAELVARLSPEAQTTYAQTGAAEAQKKLILAWIQSTLSQNRYLTRAFGEGSWPGQGELEKFFEEQLTSDQRADLLRLPADEMQRELRRMHLQSTVPAGFRPLPHGDGPRRQFREERHYEGGQERRK